VRNQTFSKRKNEGPDKVLSLEQSVEKCLRSGMVLHIGDSANAIVRHVIRQFWGSKPDFTVIASSAEDYVLDMVHAGQVKKLIFALCSESYPTRGPSKIIQRAFRESSIEIENWSLHTIVQRLMAGAMGLPCMPTRSLLETTTAKENVGSFMELRDPFGSGERVGLVKSLLPDLSLIHALAADRAGNLIPAPSSSSGQGVWGALASKEGVLVTTEKIVSTDFLRKYSHMVQIPSYLVKSVSLAPLGAHPQGLFNLGIRGIDSYGPDYEFMEKHRQSSSRPEDLDAWIEKWVRECPSHDDYLQKLGSMRLDQLKDTHQSFSSKMRDLPPPSLDKPFNSTERMVVVAARKIIGRLKEAQHVTVLTGTGIAMLASWLAYYQIRDEKPEVQLVTGTGLFGYTPSPGEPQRAGSVSNTRTAKILSDVSHMYGVFIAGETNRCISVLGTAQIDQWGNMNTSRLSGNFFLTGGGGAGDAINSREVLVVSHQSKERFVNKVEYITCPGRKVRTLVSDEGVFEKRGDSEEFVLTGFYALTKGSKGSEEVAKIKSKCGWELKVSENFKEIPPPYPEEITLLRTLDPKGFFIGN